MQTASQMGKGLIMATKKDYVATGLLGVAQPSPSILPRSIMVTNIM